MFIEEVFHVDSTHRQNLATTGSNGFVWEIGKVLKNVRKAEVLYAEVPNTHYNVPVGQNTFTMVQTVSGVASTVTATVTPGNYTTSTLPTAMGTAWTTAGGNANLTFSIDSTTLRLKVTSGSSTVHATIDPSLWAFPFGMKGTATINAVTTFYESTGVVRLSSDMVLFLSIDEFDGPRASDVVVSPDSGPLAHKGILGRFQMTAGPNGINYFKDEFMTMSKNLPPSPPIHLQRLTVRWYDVHGNQIDFNGHDVSFLLRITYDA